MNPENWGIIGTLIGAFVGALSSILTTLLNNRNSIKVLNSQEKEKRKERLREFQRNNLIELQEKLGQTMRLIGKIHINDLNQYKKTNKWNLTKLEPKLNNQLADYFTKLQILIERIENDELRDKVREFTELIAKCTFSESLEESKKNLNHSLTNLGKLMQDIGSKLRNYY